MLQKFAEQQYPGCIVVGKNKSPWHYAVDLKTSQAGAITLWQVMPTQKLDNRQRKGRLNALHLYQQQLKSLMLHTGMRIESAEDSIVLTSRTPTHSAAELLEEKGFMPELVFIQVLNAMRTVFMRAPSRTACGVDARFENFGVIGDRMVYTAIHTPRV